MTGVEVSALLDRIQALEQSVEDLMSGGVARNEEPEIRVRISHSHTLRDGWRCDSTTVEWTGRCEVDWPEIGRQLRFANAVASAEADARNHPTLAGAA